MQTPSEKNFRPSGATNHHPLASFWTVHRLLGADPSPALFVGFGSGRKLSSATAGHDTKTVHDTTAAARKAVRWFIATTPITSKRIAGNADCRLECLPFLLFQIGPASKHRLGQNVEFSTYYKW
jgi:hypothetical protein